MGCFDIICDLVGIREYFADLDRDRQFWRDAPGTVFATVLDWASNAGFEACFYERSSEFPWRSNTEFRQRFMIRAARIPGF